MLDFVQMMAVS